MFPGFLVGPDMPAKDEDWRREEARRTLRSQSVRPSQPRDPGVKQNKQSRS